MIVLSVRTLHEGLYDKDVIESAVRWGYRVDPSLIHEDVKEGEKTGEKRGGVWIIVASGSFGGGNEGSSKGGNSGRAGDSDGAVNEMERTEVIVAVGAILFPSLSTSQDPTKQPKEAAKLKALFTHPSYTRLGLASIMLAKCEDEVRTAGYERLEFAATYAGVKFYQKAGYQVLSDREGNPGGPGGKGRCDKFLDDGRLLEMVFMGREL